MNYLHPAIRGPHTAPPIRKFNFSYPTLCNHIPWLRGSSQLIYWVVKVLQEVVLVFGADVIAWSYGLGEYRRSGWGGVGVVLDRQEQVSSGCECCSG